MGCVKSSYTLLLLSLLLVAAKANAKHLIDDGGKKCKAWLVQSVPTDMPELAQVPGVLRTGDVLKWLAGNATEKGSLDITAQYWEFLEESSNPKSGDYGFSKQQMEQFGAAAGKAVHDSLLLAADRGIPIRILQHTGFYPSFDAESAAIAAGRANVQNRTLVLKDWWGSGIVHAKVWIANKKDAYIGSANNDWKSLTQVKELGVYFTDCPAVAKRLESFFNNFWALTTLNASLYTKKVWDEQWQLNRTVPCWSHFLEADMRCKSPLPESTKSSNVQGYPYLSKPNFFQLDLETPSWNSGGTGGASATYISVAPPEIASRKHQIDEQGWVDTILSVPINGMVRINTMDWLGQSQFSQTVVFWPVLLDAISKVILSKQATVRVLVAHWSTSLDGTEEYLFSLNYINTLCNSSSYNHCHGKVEIKYYEVPGWEKTGPAVNATTGKATGAEFPSFARVNHAKFAVSDVRAHIGTSNLVWDYFYVTAGVSFGTYNLNVVSQLQAVFDADWHSPYAVPLQTSVSDQ